MGELVEYKANGGTASGYLAIPEQGSGPGVIVIQEWWGLVDHIKDVCERFAGEGFVALAPDLYHGKTTKSPDEAGKLMMALRIDEAEKDISGAITKAQCDPAGQPLIRTSCLPPPCSSVVIRTRASPNKPPRTSRSQPSKSAPRTTIAPELLSRVSKSARRSCALRQFSSHRLADLLHGSARE